MLDVKAIEEDFHNATWTSKDRASEEKEKLDEELSALCPGALRTPDHSSSAHRREVKTGEWLESTKAERTTVSRK